MRLEALVSRAATAERLLAETRQNMIMRTEEVRAFDRKSVDYLETLGVKRHKVASFELVDLPLIKYMASKGKPMILSTGMATSAEIAAAVHAASNAGQNTTLLKCTSAYPADASDANLSAGKCVRPHQWGISDHTMGIGVACAAAAIGATMIEKHLSTVMRWESGDICVPANMLAWLAKIYGCKMEEFLDGVRPR
jgi:sialic acid synthase SpsE